MGNKSSKSSDLNETGRDGKGDAGSSSSTTHQAASPLASVQETANDPGSTRPSTAVDGETASQQLGGRGDSNRSGRQTGEPLTGDTTAAAGVSDVKLKEACHHGTSPEPISVTISSTKTASSVRTVKPRARIESGAISTAGNDGETAHSVRDGSSTESSNLTASSVQRTDPGAMGENGMIKKESSTATLGVDSSSYTTGDSGGTTQDKSQHESSTVVIKPSSGGAGISNREDIGGMQRSGTNHIVVWNVHINNIKSVLGVHIVQHITMRSRQVI